MKWLLTASALALLTATLPLSSRAQSYISDDIGLSWYPDYDDDELLPWYSGIREDVLAQRYPSNGLIRTSPDYDDDPGSELIETSPGYVDRSDTHLGLLRADDFATDDYGAYDRDYDWTTDDAEFDEWFGGSDEAFDRAT